MTSETGLLMLLALLLLIWLWFDSMKSGEKAIHAVKNACNRMNLQLLDETVALKKLGLLSLFRGKGITRRYEFEYDDGTQRRRKSHITIEGKTIVEIGFYNTPDKVVQFPGKRKASNDR